MKSLPSNIPRSLHSYVELYKDDPDRAIGKLRKQIDRRGPDAVGHYLLAWFYHRKGERREAIRAAWKAKIYAPGSPVMEQFHYYMTHPDAFNAWTPADTMKRHRNIRSPHKLTHSISDLDALITKLSSVESRRIRLDASPDPGEDVPDLSEQSSQVDDIVTETLAVIHEKQGNLSQAIETYQKLTKLNDGEKADEYEKKIRDLRARQEEEEES
jgi:tetratricopeptide (TPR) repeat protein